MHIKQASMKLAQMNMKRVSTELELARNLDRESTQGIASSSYVKENVIFFVSFSAANCETREKVIAIKDIIRSQMKENFNDVYIGYELMDTDLHQIIRSHQDLTDDHCRVCTFYFLFALSVLMFMYQSNAFLIIIISFFAPYPQFSNPDLMHTYMYSCMINHFLQCSLNESGVGFLRRDNSRRYFKMLPQFLKKNVYVRFPNVSPGVVDLLEKILVFDPNKHITVDEALCHPYLAPFMISMRSLFAQGHSVLILSIHHLLKKISRSTSIGKL
ncbi:hypothetical protein Ddye_001678 [Dipteronia dyeriana]|uniref:Protein kinase domain-containing protein n=1 Tax=Dipteronia dyeriana TaxID=168575 RepID=A0AAD9XNZ9_9ROSI|nr:hypothetical protein Ddye_001678 [Dipteronia dyeriana]